MKKKPETKKIFAEEQETEKVVETAPVNKEMNDEEFDRYIGDIMVKEDGKEDEKVKTDDIQTLRDDVNGLMRKLDILTDFIRKKSTEQKFIGADSSKNYDAALKERERKARILKHMQEQENDIKKDFSDFDFRALYSSDPSFKDDFDRLGNLYGAYLKYLAKKMSPGSKPARSFVENGAMPSMVAGSISTSPAGLPDSEFEEYIKNIMGE